MLPDLLRTERKVESMDHKFQISHWVRIWSAGFQPGFQPALRSADFQSAWQAEGLRSLINAGKMPALHPGGMRLR